LRKFINSWYHREEEEKVEDVAQVDTVERREPVSDEPIDKTIKVTDTNRKRINALAGKLASVDGECHSQNDAVNYLFDNLEKKEKAK